MGHLVQWTATACLPNPAQGGNQNSAMQPLRRVSEGTDRRAAGWEPQVAWFARRIRAAACHHPSHNLESPTLDMPRGTWPS